MLLVSLFMACGNDMGKFEGPRCEEEEFAVESSEETLLGFTPQDAADQMPLSNTVGLEWEDGTVDCLHYSLQLDPDSGRDVESTYVPASGIGAVPAIDLECNDYVALDGTLSVSTPDGEISEEIAITMIYNIDVESGEATGSFYDELPVLSGSFQAENADASSKYFISGSIVSGQFSGSLIMQTSGEDGDIAWAENAFLADWGHVDAPQECLDDNE